ncbi:magnesium-translocating P-type ATPase [Sphingomonas oryzagri]
MPITNRSATHVAPAFWTAPPADLFARLESSPEGLTQEEAGRRLEDHGPNEIVPRQHRRWPMDLLKRLTNPLVAMLLVAAAIAGATGDGPSFAIIVAVVMLSTVLDMVQQHRAEAAAEALKRSIALNATAMRDGAAVEMPVRDLVPGDVITLSAGDLVPADGIVIVANALQVNEAILTGEPYPVGKRAGEVRSEDLADASNALFHGTSVVGGTGTMLVAETGADTQFGAIAASLARKQAPTSFEVGVHRLGLLIVRLTLFLVLFVLLAHLALGRPPLQSFLFAMALAVGLTPELLPMIMTVALARGAQRMASAKVVVKRLSAIHDLGQMDILCTDKTGTLTEAHISLVGHPAVDGADRDRVAELAAVNARFETGLKSPLDEALLQHTAAESLAAWRKLDERPFDFERRRVSVLAERDGERIEIVKGAPETVLALCSAAEQSDGSVAPLDEATRARLVAMLDERTAQGLRLLGIAWKPAVDRVTIDTDDDSGLIFAGYGVFVDPAKPSATGAIARLASQGVRIKVISGDSGAVVEHLVKALALNVEGLLTGEEVADLSDEALAARAEDVDLFARITPDQKTRIVRALRARGHTVGFIGDGINDAPAIRAADVGLSVDGATDVAREAADMILLAPDLGVLADGVAEGRRTYANIMKYIRMATSSNFGNMLTMAIASLWLPFLPLTPVQVLLNNLLYDLSETGIPFDYADPGEVATPHGWDLRQLMRFTAIMGALSSAFDLVTFALLQHLHIDVAQFRTAWFLESMATQMLVVFVIRSARPFWSSRAHPALIVTTLAGLAVACVLPFLPLAQMLGFASPPPFAVACIALLVLAYLAGADRLKQYALGRHQGR